MITTYYTTLFSTQPILWPVFHHILNYDTFYLILYYCMTLFSPCTILWYDTTVCEDATITMLDWVEMRIGRANIGSEAACVFCFIATSAVIVKFLRNSLSILKHLYSVKYCFNNTSYLITPECVSVLEWFHHALQCGIIGVWKSGGLPPSVSHRVSCSQIRTCGFRYWPLSLCWWFPHVL